MRFSPPPYSRRLRRRVRVVLDVGVDGPELVSDPPGPPEEEPELRQVLGRALAALHRVGGVVGHHHDLAGEGGRGVSLADDNNIS